MIAGDGEHGPPREGDRIIKGVWPVIVSWSGLALQDGEYVILVAVKNAKGEETVMSMSRPDAARLTVILKESLLDAGRGGGFRDN